LHYGSAEALTENKTSLNSYFLTVDTRPFEQIALSFRAAITDAHMGFDPLSTWTGPVDAIHHLDFEGYQEVNTYSDLDDNIYEFGLTLNYLISDNLSILAEANYNKFEDYQPYVYGDTTGKWFYGKLAVRYIF